MGSALIKCTPHSTKQSVLVESCSSKQSASFKYCAALTPKHPDVTRFQVREALNAIEQKRGSRTLVKETFQFAAGEKQDDTDQQDIIRATNTRLTMCAACHKNLATPVNKPCNHHFLCAGCSEGYRQRNNDTCPVCHEHSVLIDDDIKFLVVKARLTSTRGSSEESAEEKVSEGSPKAGEKATELCKSETTDYTEMIQSVKPEILPGEVRGFLRQHHKLRGTMRLGVEFFRWLQTRLNKHPQEHVTTIRCDLCYEDWESTYIVRDTHECDHYMCVGCMVSNFRAALRDASLFCNGGVKCPVQGCSKTTCSRTFDQLVALAKDVLPDKRTDEVAFTANEIRRCRRFIAKSSIPVCQQVYCHNPACGGRDEDGELLVQDIGPQQGFRKFTPWTCKYCKSNEFQLCRRCKTKWHPTTLSCGRAQEKRVQAEQRAQEKRVQAEQRAQGARNLKQCKNAADLKTKNCPKCKAKIHKSGGCLHMQCPMCKWHFCWRCLYKANTSSKIYDHCKEKHGGYSDN